MFLNIVNPTFSVPILKSLQKTCQCTFLIPMPCLSYRLLPPSILWTSLFYDSVQIQLIQRQFQEVTPPTVANSVACITIFLAHVAIFVPPSTLLHCGQADTLVPVMELVHGQAQSMPVFVCHPGPIVSLLNLEYVWYPSVLLHSHWHI